MGINVDLRSFRGAYMLARHGSVNTVSAFNSNPRPRLDALHWRHCKSMIDTFIEFRLYFSADIDGNAYYIAVIW